MSDWPALRLLETQCQALRKDITAPNLTKRQQHRLEQELSLLEQKIDRQKRCRTIYNQLAPEVPRSSIERATKSLKMPATTKQTSFMRDLSLPQPTLVAHGAEMDFVDVCQCGELMQRHPTMSFTTCPKCFCKRIEIDMCARDVTAFVDSRNENSRRAGGTRTMLKNASHYGTFLNSNRCRKTKAVNTDRLHQLCKFCYVEGARAPNDITPKIVNRAQKHIGGAVEYPMTRTYVSLLRDDVVSIPDVIKPQLMRLYSFVQPVYSQQKTEDETADNRINMPKFTFVTRILCRLLGMDVLVPLFDNFSMSDIVLRRTSAMRRVFRQLGWTWTDNLADDDINEAMLDAFDLQNKLS